MLYIYIIFFILGLLVGSFLNVVIFRIDDLKSIFLTRSHCPKCKETIKWYDLVPLFSFILLRGRCRNCGSQISLQYPLVELGTGILFFLVIFFFGLSWLSAFYLIIISILMVISVYDFRTQTIPDIFSYALLILSALLGWFLAGFSPLNMLFGALIGGGVIALLAIISKEKWMGFGDIAIGAALGALVGYPRAIILVFLAFVIGSVFGLILIGSKQKGLKDSVPFAPFLALAAVVTLFYGTKIIEWYLGYLYF